MRLRSWGFPVLALVFVLSLLFLRTAGGQVFTTESQRRWIIQTQQPDISNWQLQDQYGRYFSLSDLGNQSLLIDFIFTRCATICRAAGSRYAQIQQQIRDWEQPPLLMSISIDPDYDTPVNLLAYQQRYTKQESGWIVARPVDVETLEIIKQETGITVIPDGAGGFAHTDSFHRAQHGQLLTVLDWINKDVVAQLK